jgi:hypothetical protein
MEAAMSNGGDFDVKLWRVTPLDKPSRLRISTPPDVHLRVCLRADSKVTALEAAEGTVLWKPAYYEVTQVR